MKAGLLNNRYRIIQTLGRGGFGETYLTEDTHMPSGRKCVLKQLKPIVKQPKTPLWMKERFQREAAILEQLGEGHEQIPRLYAYFSEDDKFYLVQEWIEGLTLDQYWEKEGNLHRDEVRQILVQLLPVLNYVHARRIIHRDIKPENIILRQGDHLPFLIDFGAVKEAMATEINQGSSSTYSASIGTPGYMSSEQAAGRPIYSSDLYSLGLTAIFLLTGKSPNELETDPRNGEIIWQEHAFNLDPELAAVLDKAIRFHPRDRFSTAQEMLDTLNNGVKSSKTNLTGVTLNVAPRNKSL
ncbi:MAG: protein kinase domain-containing protein, partial [Waterburya sp.]